MANPTSGLPDDITSASSRLDRARSKTGGGVWTDIVEPDNEDVRIRCFTIGKKSKKKKNPIVSCYFNVHNVLLAGQNCDFKYGNTHIQRFVRSWRIIVLPISTASLCVPGPCASEPPPSWTFGILLRYTDDNVKFQTKKPSRSPKVEKRLADLHLNHMCFNNQ